jgi:tetratricopeptide (TPR) repeat protein
MSEELDDSLYARITELSDQGNDYVEDGNFDEAIEKYKEALALMPEPIEEWEASTWLMTALGETYFFKQDYKNALQTLQNAMHCPDAIGNPLIHLRLGQVQFEVGNQARAKDELARAYMGGGEEIFEDEDPKYLDLVKKTLRPPIGS